MIWGGSTPDPRFMSEHAKRPWDNIEPAEKVHTCDSQDVIDYCLQCELKKCSTRYKYCIFNKSHKDSRKKRTHKETLELDEKVKNMIYAGWRPEMLIKEMNITEPDYYESRKRLIRRGELTDGRKGNGSH